MDYYVSVPLKRLAADIEFFPEEEFHPEVRMMDAEYLLGMTEADIEASRRLLDERSLSVFTHGPFFGLDVASLDGHLSKYSIDCIQKGLEVTAALGGSVMVIHTAYLPMFSRGGRRHWFRYWGERMPELALRAQAKGITLALENTWEDRPEVLLHLLEMLPEGAVEICLDTGHMNAFSRLSVGRWWDVLGERVIALHLHDNDGLSDDHLIPGRGTFDFGTLMRLVAGSGRTILFDLEVDRSLAAEGRRYLESFRE